MLSYDNENKILTIAHYILDNQTTIRATAKEFNIPKSTIHHYLNVNLKQINKHLYKKVKVLLMENFKTKHIHGGESTKRKYENLKKIINKNDEIDAFCL